MSGSMTRVALTLLAALALSCHIGAAAQADHRETPLVRAVQQCRRSVVNIHTERLAPDDKESRFFSARSRKVSGMGTGIIVDERGYIVTNYHVIQDVDKIVVTMEGGATFDGRPVSFDRKQDLAIIRIDCREPLTVMPMGTSVDLMLAETVFAVGNAFGYEHTITSGIISALHRDVEVDETQSYQNLIQTDASINPGNSGGPLLNLNGEVIGINVAIRAGAQRIGFAIPIDDARRTIARLMSVERLNGIPHGLTTVDVKQPGEHKLIVEQVAPGSASDQCGLKSGDVIRSIRGMRVHDGTDLERSLLDLPVGKVVDVVLQRDGREQTLQFTVGVGKAGTLPAIAAAAESTAAASAAAAETRTVSATAAPEPTIAAGAAPAPPAEKMTTRPAADPILEKAWELLGIRLEELNDQELRAVRGRYNGGMKVVNVRSGSVAARYGMKSGDILVGLDDYETLGASNLKFILSDERLKALQTMRFLIVRTGSATPLAGNLDLKSVHR